MIILMIVVMSHILKQKYLIKHVLDKTVIKHIIYFQEKGLITIVGYHFK